MAAGATKRGAAERVVTPNVLRHTACRTTGRRTHRKAQSEPTQGMKLKAPEGKTARCGRRSLKPSAGVRLGKEKSGSSGASGDDCIPTLDSAVGCGRRPSRLAGPNSGFRGQRCGATIPQPALCRGTQKGCAESRRQFFQLVSNSSHSTSQRTGISNCVGPMQEIEACCDEGARRQQHRILQAQATFRCWKAGQHPG
jgi:hypothetical protein